MLVYNLTQGEVTYKGRKIPPNGGSVDYRDLSFIPNRDRELEKAKILSFGSLPQWWNVQQALKASVTAPSVAQPVKSEKKLVITMADSAEATDKSSVSSFNKKK